MQSSNVTLLPTAVDYDPFAGATLERVVPATASQRELWLASKLETEASLAYNESVSLRLRSALDVAALQQAVQALVDRHEALRATFGSDGHELCIASHVDISCPLRDLSALDAASRDAAVATALQAAVTTPFDLELGPLVRAELLLLDAQDHLLLFTAHHIICDGWSFGVIVGDLAALYAQALGQGDALGAADTFSEFALAEASRAGSHHAAQQEQYWLGRFKGSLPALDLPVDRVRRRQRSFASLREDRTLDGELVAALKRVGARQGASLYAGLLSGFAALLYRLTGQDDVVIGIPSAGQAAEGHASLVGHCVNVLPLRSQLDPQQPFSSLLKQVRGDLLDAFEHGQYTLGSLLERLAMPRDPRRLPLVSVLFNLDQALDERSVSFPGLHFEFAGNARTFENFELFINAVQLEHGLRLECQYNSDLFRAETIRCWLDAYETLLRSVVEQADTSVNALGIMSGAAQLALDALQPEATPYPEQQLAHEYFEQQVDRTPDRIAARHRGEPCNYAELEARANQLAHTLRARGIGRGQFVGIALPRGIDMLASLLAVLKTGAGYVPLDPTFPADRLNFMIEDAGLSALIVDDGAPCAMDFPAERLLSLHGEAAAIATASSTRLPRDEQAATPDTRAYMIYTSGSTGRPKGVQVPHRTTSNLLSSWQREPGLKADDRLVAVTTLSFDIAFIELMLPLSVGAEVVIADRDDVRDGKLLRRLLEESAATVMQATPAGWRILLEAGWAGHAGFRAICGGEPLAVDLAEALLQRCAELWNGYGPTETTVYSTCWKVSQPRQGIFIGQPIANTVVHVLDEQLAPCPLGVPGELYIGGAGVTLGYWNRPELNAERFLVDPYAEQPGGRMYRTGDRGRWLANGLLEHLGRLDFQVKVRGFRIELGEIEATLVDLPEVERAVVMAREDQPGDVRLVAYVVLTLNATFDQAELRNQLRQKLPDYMLPQHFVALTLIPLLPNGKTDRKALPAPMAQASELDGPRIAPRNEDEQRVAEAMEQVLSLPELDVRDDFFAMGGHSLLAAQLTARLNREFGLNLSLRTLFDAPTIATLAAAIRQQLTSGSSPANAPIEVRDEQHRAPLSLMQSRLWALEELQPGRVTYNAPSAHRLRGKLDEAALEFAMQALIQRQPSLRTAFRREGDDVVQIVVPDVALQLFPAEDLSHLPDEQQHVELMQRLQQLTDTPFDLTQAPLFRARMFRLAADEHVLFFMPHHIIWDGWSFDIFHNELAALYRAFSEGEPSPLAPLTVSYGDFAAWHTQWLDGPQFKEQLAFWRERLAAMTNIRALPTDQPRRPGMSGVGRTEWIHVSREATDALHVVARLADATLNMTLLALYYVLLSSMAGDRELVVGTPVRGRNQGELESVMGYFNNLLPLHVSVNDTLSFVDFVRYVKRAAIDSFGSPDVPLEYLQRELRVGAGTGAVLYQALFSFQDGRQRSNSWGDLAHEQILLFQSGATEDLGLWFLEREHGMVGGITYNADILQGETARVLRDRYLRMLTQITADPAQSVATLAAISMPELDQLIAWNTTTTPVALAANLHGLFEQHADRAPQRTALSYGSWGSSYGELEHRANRIARCLRKRGAGNGSVVGLCEEPGPNRIAGMYAILKLGAVCVLLDHTDPAARLRQIIGDARITLLLGSSALELPLQWAREQALWFDADLQELMGTPDQRLPSETADVSEQVALVSYLPDMLGRPVGAAFTHAALANLLQGLQQALELGGDERILATAAPATGEAICEILLPLSLGAELILATRNEVRDGATLAQLAQQHRASALFATGDAWHALSQHWQGNAELRAIVTGALPAPELAEQLVQHCAGLWTLSGSADGVPAATCGRVLDPQQSLHSGQPLGNTVVWILDAQRQPCPIGAIGEIYVGGASLSHPFGQRAELVQQEHTHITAPDANATALRRTCCNGRWLASGHVQVLGRIDRREHVDGHQLDLATIEAELLSQPGVMRAIALARLNQAGSTHIDAYVVAAAGAQLDGDLLTAALAQSLPAHEVPQHIIVLDSLPLKANGAIDTNALPLPGAASDNDEAYAATQPKTANEQLLAAIWKDLLGLTQVHTSDNFFDVGGHSLLAVDMAARVQRDTGLSLNLLDIANGTLGMLAAGLSESATQAPAAPKRSRLRQWLGLR